MGALMWKRLVAAMVVATTTLLVTHWLRDYPWSLAALSGASLGALTFASLQTFVRLRATLAQYGPRPSTPDGPDPSADHSEPTDESALAPGPDPDRDQEQ